MKADQHRQRIAILMLKAEAERLAIGELVNGYRRTTEPFDRVYLKATDILRARPLLSTLMLGLGTIATIAVSRRLQRLPVLGLIRGATLAAGALRHLRASSN